MTDEVDTAQGLRVAVVGSGPAGVYAAQALLAANDKVRVDVLDRLPAPFGLVRYGVAPDHPKIKSIARALRQVMESPRVRFFGNVCYGSDVTAADLRRRYHAVVHARGAPRSRRLGVPGEDLAGSAAAADFVSWYNGEPDGPLAFPLTAPAVAVVGAGNVALDAARMLMSDRDAIARTDVPDPVLAAFGANRTTDVYLFARRGPQHTRFTTPELRELAALPGVDLLVDPADLPPEDDPVEYDRTTRNNLATLRNWAARPRTGAPRRIHFGFWSRPVRLVGADAVEALEVERTTLADGRVVGTGCHRTVAVQAVLRAVGYLAVAEPGLPFDAGTGSVPHAAGRVVDTDGRAMPGVYVAGWSKRGPTGVIGTNKSDAAETVRTLCADAAAGLLTPPEPDDLTELLAERAVGYTTWQGWLRLEAHELAAGRRQGRPAAKVADRATMLGLAGSDDPAGPLR